MDRDFDIVLTQIRDRISQADPLLAALVQSHEIQYGITVRLAGVTISGIPSPSVTTGAEIDRQALGFAQALHAISISTGEGDGHWPELEKLIRESAMFTKLARRADDARDRVSEYTQSADLDETPQIQELPDHLVRDALIAYAPPKFFTLTSAVIQRDDGTTQEIDNMRVNLAAVEAWWTFDLSVPEEAQEALAQLQHDDDGAAANRN